MDRNYLDNQEEDRSLGAALDRMHKKLSEAEAYTSVANQALDKIEADMRKDRMGIVSNYLAGSSDGDFLKAQNIPQGKEMHLTIANIEMRNNLFPDEHGKGEDKLIATFVETRQATGKQAEMVLNVTNTRTLVEAWGEDESTWMGKKVYLRRDITNFKGETVPCLRVRAEVDVANQVDDEIPF